MTTPLQRLLRAVFVLAAAIAWVTNITRLLQFALKQSQGALVLSYHRVVADPHRAIGYRGNMISSQRFGEHLEYLQANYKLVGMGEIASLIVGGAKQTDPTPLLITFDDGYRDTLETGIRLLHDRGIPSVFFVAAGVLDGRMLLPADSLTLAAEGKDERRRFASMLYVTTEGLRQAPASGALVGSHTLTHPVLHNLDESSIRHELTHSRKVLGDDLGFEVDSFSYPIGSDPSQLKSYLRASGYCWAFSNRQRAVFAGIDELEIPRVSAGDLSVPMLALKLNLIRLASWLRSALARSNFHGDHH